MKKAILLYLLSMLRTPWEEISIDVIGPLLRSKDKDAILFIVDQFFKIIRLMAITIINLHRQSSKNILE